MLWEHELVPQDFPFCILSQSSCEDEETRVCVTFLGAAFYWHEWIRRADDDNFNNCLYDEHNDRMWSVSTETEGRTLSYRSSVNVAIFGSATMTSPKKINSPKKFKFLRAYYINFRVHGISPSTRMLRKAVLQVLQVSLFGLFVLGCPTKIEKKKKKKTRGFFCLSGDL